MSFGGHGDIRESNLVCTVFVNEIDVKFWNFILVYMSLLMYNDTCVNHFYY